MIDINFNELLQMEFEQVRVDHPLLSKMDKIRMSGGKDTEGYNTFKVIYAYLTVFTEKEMKEIINNGKWYIK